MEFINETDCAAQIFRSELTPNEMYNSVITRIRYVLLEDMSLERAKNGSQTAIIRDQPVEDSYGVLEPDEFDVRSGTDLIILGDAISPHYTTPSMEVMVAAGPYNQTLRVFGERTWQSTLTRGLIPSEPLPFTTLPITLRNAYGGAAAGEYGPLPFTRNPSGKGYYLTKRDATDHPLPNIEDPARLIKTWEDQPDPAGLGPYPSYWGLRTEPCLQHDPATNEPIFTQTLGLHDHAHPRLSGQRVLDGDSVLISGMSVHGDVAFTIPNCPLEVEVQLSQRVHVRSLHLEEILIDLRSHWVDLTYRKVFHYDFKPFQTRRTRLCWRAQKTEQ